MKGFIVFAVFFALVMGMCVGSTVAQESQLVESIVATYIGGRSSFAIGFDFTYLIGSMTRTGFGWPKSSFGITVYLGADYRAYGIPSVERVRAVARSIVTSRPNITYSALVKEVKRRLSPGILSYVQTGTELLIIPKFGFGFLIPIIGYNLFVDLGLNFPSVLNIGIIAAF